MTFLPKIQRRTQYTGESGISGYRKFKLEISQDCRGRCVYCDLHANNLGGYEMMELDHFRPKKRDLYPELVNDPFNLLLACRSCNNKKRDDWPAGKSTDTHTDGVGYIDPFDDRHEYYSIDDFGRMTSKKAPAQYVIDRLVLNRPLAIAVRKRVALLGMLDRSAQRLEAEHNKLLDEAIEVDRARLRTIVELLGQIRKKIMEQVITEGPAI